MLREIDEETYLGNAADNWDAVQRKTMEFLDAVPQASVIYDLVSDVRERFMEGDYDNAILLMASVTPLDSSDFLNERALALSGAHWALNEMTGLMSLIEDPANMTPIEKHMRMLMLRAKRLFDKSHTQRQREKVIASQPAFSSDPT